MVVGLGGIAAIASFQQVRFNPIGREESLRDWCPDPNRFTTSPIYPIGRKPGFETLAMTQL